jgi:hypothetical protein
MSKKDDKRDFFNKLYSSPILSQNVFPISQYPPVMQTGTNSHMHTFNSYGMPVHSHTPPSSMAEWVGEVHGLKIVNYAEDIGQDGYQEELDWEIFHPGACKRGISYEDQIHDWQRMDRVRPIEYHCEMAEEIKKYGLNRLEMDWTQIEPGEYRIRLEVSKEVYIASGSNWNQWGNQDLPTRIRLL